MNHMSGLFLFVLTIQEYFFKIALDLRKTSG